ncbi:PD-(D/E)XK nuclease family protein [Candidatus Ruminimicrobium bovinum]|uniref:PD-(D/E)XK nuclease family protein n=1 Tax=Candidatus Ruminimicrobium bovinum TaxID=3242779 RepID=UPI0039B83098
MNKSELIKNLKSSPIYNMSQDSLENFHTSFLCWLGNTYPEKFIKLFNDKRFDKTKEYNCKKQVIHTNSNKNEGNKNIRTDLEFQFNDNELIIIENKMKSYPDYNQLEKYYDIICKEKKETTFILLSLVDKINLPKQWICISYSDLAKKMNKIFCENVEYKKDYQDYHKCLMQDYINVINLLSKSFPEKNNEIYDLDEQKKQIIDDLQDIYIKYRTSELANYINKEIRKKCNWEIKESFSAKSKEGVVDVIRKLDENNRFHIQIQGKQYSYGFVYLEGKSTPDDIWKERIKIANKLKDQGYWFVDIKDPKRKTKCENFYSYKPDFIYRQSNKGIDEKTTYKEITNRIKKDIEKFEQNLVEIQNCIYEFVKY